MIIKTHMRDSVVTIFSWFQLKKGEETRLSLDKQAEEKMQDLQESLKKAAEQRDENIKKMLERLQERVSPYAFRRQFSVA